MCEFQGIRRRFNARISQIRARYLFIFFTLLSPELYKEMIKGRGWSQDPLETWITQMLEEALFAPSERIATR